MADSTRELDAEGGAVLVNEVKSNELPIVPNEDKLISDVVDTVDVGAVAKTPDHITQHDDDGQPPFKKIKLEDVSDEQVLNDASIDTTNNNTNIESEVDVSSIPPMPETESTTVAVEAIQTPETPLTTANGELAVKVEPQVVTNNDIDAATADAAIVTTSIQEHEDEDDLFGGGDDVSGDKDKSEIQNIIEAPKVVAVKPEEIQAEAKVIQTETSTSESVVEKLESPKLETLESVPEVITKAEAIFAVTNGVSDGTPLTEAQNPPSTDLVENQTAPVVESPAKTEFSIPRKSNSIQGKANLLNKQVYTPGTRYGLPPGVNVPASIVRSKLLESEMNTPGSKLMDVLKSLPVNLINDALTEYDDAVEIKGANSIRNHGAYLYGVVKRYVSVRDRFLNGDSSGGANPMGDDGLTSVVQARLDQLVTSGFCSHQEMNDKVKSKIRMLSEKDAMFALDELSSVERSQIRNFGSYFMGILNRYMRGDASSKNRTPSMNHHHNSHLSNRHHQQNQSQNRDRNRFPPPPPQASHNQSSSSYHNPSNLNNNRFGGQQRSQPPFRMDNNPSAAYDRNRHQQQQTQVPSWQNQQQPPPNQYMSGGGNMMNPMVPNMGNNPQNTTGMPPTNFSYPGQQPPQQYATPQQPPLPYMQSSQQQPTFGQPNAYAPTGAMPNNNVLYQPQQSGMIGQHQQQFMSNPTSLPQQQQQPPMMNNQAPQYIPTNPIQQQGSIDILGLADKAASAIQALGANKLNQPLSQGQYPPGQMGGPSQLKQQGYQLPYNPVNNQMMGQQQPNMVMQPRPPQSNFAPHQMYPAPMSQQQPQTYGGPNPNIMNQQPQQQQQQQGARRRTTASFNELPVSVQYALQNLIAIGAIDGQPDDGILGMIMDLPEQMALAGLQKFATIDKSTMRNKFAYLAGVLRRELEGIHRR